MLRAVPIVCLLLFSGACLELIVTTEFPAAFDELEHISYAAYLQETGRLLPRFEEQKIPSVPMTLRQRAPGILDLGARKDHLADAHAPPGLSGSLCETIFGD